LKTEEAPLVLMADDDEDDCTLAKRAFKESGAVGALSCVEGGIELMAHLLGPGPLPALILLDLNMPLKDGRETLKDIKSVPALKKIPLVVLTTSREEKDMAYSREMGADSFITKPSAFTEWVSIMKSLADRWLAAR
jgi:CheY-like chemotaxis protein